MKSVNSEDRRSASANSSKAPGKRSFGSYEAQNMSFGGQSASGVSSLNNKFKTLPMVSEESAQSKEFNI